MQVPATLRQETPELVTPGVPNSGGGPESICPSPSDLGERFEEAAKQDEFGPMVPVAMVPVVVADIPPSQPRFEFPDSPGQGTAGMNLSSSRHLSHRPNSLTTRSKPG